MPASRHASRRRGSGHVAPEVADARPEEAADAAPAGRDDGAGRGQPDAHVELPERAPDAAREPELQHRNRPAGPDDARELAQRRGHVVDVAEEVREGERVELPVGERQRLGAPLAQLDPVAQPGVPRSAHVPAASISGLWSTPITARAGSALRELDRHRRRSARDVEHAPRVGRDPRDEKRAPARVLPEREEAGVAVVRRAERREQLARVAGAGGGLHDRILAA